MMLDAIGMELAHASPVRLPKLAKAAPGLDAQLLVQQQEIGTDGHVFSPAHSIAAGGCGRFIRWARVRSRRRG